MTNWNVSKIVAELVYFIRSSPGDVLIDLLKSGVSVPTYLLYFHPQKVFPIWVKFGVWVDLDQICASV